MEYVDFNLPSGTLWASDLMYNSHNSSIYFDKKEIPLNIELPTYAQINELYEYCKLIRSAGTFVISKPGISKLINLPKLGFFYGNRYISPTVPLLWIKDEECLGFRCIELHTYFFRQYPGERSLQSFNTFKCCILRVRRKEHNNFPTIF